MTLAMNCLNVHNDSFQIIEEILGTTIFNSPAYPDYFLSKVNILFERLAMPINVGNHFCLIIVDFRKNTFSFIDPLANERNKVQQYFAIFKLFLHCYDKHHGTNYSAINIKVTFYEHIIQRDAFNCGPLVLYFFDKINKGESPTQFCDMAEYRKYLQNILLRGSSDMAEVCLKCTNITSEKDRIQCVFCLRFVHDECLVADGHGFITNGMCDICRLY